MMNTMHVFNKLINFRVPIKTGFGEDGGSVYYMYYQKQLKQLSYSLEKK